MADIKVLNYYPQPYGDHQLGFCTVDMEGKGSVILKVVKSKKGHVYCTFTSVKIGGDWMASFSLQDRGYERKILNKCLEQLKPMMEPSKPEQPQVEDDPFHKPSGEMLF